MPKNPQQLSQKQVDVLAWVQSGCPDGIYTDGWEHRIIARALERRGLVSIGGRGPTWVATITTAGRAWLQARRVADILPEDSEADRLITRVLEAGGSLTVAGTDAEIKPWGRLVRMSLRSPNRPEGKQLTISRIGSWGSKEWTISFVEYFDDFVTARPVPVSQRVGTYHPVVKAYLDNRDWQHVSKQHLSRAARILQGVALEAERRGIPVLEPGMAQKNKARPPYKPLIGHLWLITDHGDYSVEVKEIPGTGGAKREYSGRYPSNMPKWINRRTTDFVSTGKLELILDGRFAPHQGQHFRDAKSRTVEDKLSQVFASLDKYALEADWREQERIRQEAERRRRWDAAMSRAKAEYVRHAKWEHFTALVTRSEVVAGYRRFLTAAEQAAAELPDDARVAAMAYLAEMTTTIDAHDPLASPTLLVPMLADPSPEQLKPFLGGWSPFGTQG